MHRRGFLRGMSLAGAAAWAAHGEALAAPALGDEHDDECGVTSGDPAADALTLWARVPRAARQRVLPGAHEAQGTLTVRWWIACESKGVVTFLQEGEVATSAARDWTVKVRATALPAQTSFTYGFSVEDAWQSALGHARTLPEADADIASLTFAYVSCQHYGTGFYNVYETLARDARVDFCVHLGDAIYENVSALDRLVQVRPEPVGEATTLEEYRARYLLTLRDPAYREARRRFTWIVLPDDHEVFNDYAGTEPRTAARRAAAFQAYFEFNGIDDAPFPRLHRAFRFGRLATLIALDERQYRDGAVCAGKVLKTLCAAAKDPARTMLGVSQKAWLKEEVHASGTHWNVLLSQVMMMPQVIVDRPAGVERSVREAQLSHSPFADGVDALRERAASGDLYLTLDAFDGYPAERAELADFLAGRGQGNTLVWTGDIHNCYAGYLEAGARHRAAFEMTTGSLTTLGIGDVLRWGSARLAEGHILRANPHFTAIDLRHHMYVRVTLSAQGARHETVCVDTVLRTRFQSFVGESLDVAKGTLAVSRPG